MKSMRGELEKALSNVGRDFEEDQLAFLTLTSKPELQIRDALAWRLHRALPDLIVSREWRRTDLAVLDRAGNPLMLLEAKAMATFDQVNPKKMDGEFDSYFRSDYEKASRLAQDVTEIFILIISAHHRHGSARRASSRDQVPEPHQWIPSTVLASRAAREGET